MYGLLGCIGALLGLAFVAQLWLTSAPSFRIAAFVLLWAAGAAAGVLAARATGARGSCWLVGPAAATGPVSRPLVTLALGCSGLAAVLVWRSALLGLATWCWIAGMAVLIYAVRAPGRVGRPALPDLGAGALVLTAILVLAAALRLLSLDSLPYYVNYAEAGAGLTARRVAQGEVTSLFSYGFTYVPNLAYAVQGLFLRLFGDGLFALRLSSVVPGVAAVGVLAALGAELFNRRTGLLAAVLLAVYHVDIQYSRIGMLHAQAILVVLLTLLFLIRCLRTGSRGAAVGVAVGLCLALQTYVGARVCLVLVPLIAVVVLATQGRAFARSRLPAIRWILLGALVSLGPLTVFIVSTWRQYNNRTHQVFIFAARQLGKGGQAAPADLQERLGDAALQLWHAVQTLNFAGDVAVSYPTWYPILDTMSGALLTAALAYAVCRLPRLGPLVCLVVIVAVLLMGGALTTRQPDWDRLVIMSPFLALVIAAFLDGLWQTLEQRATLSRLAPIGALVLLATIARGNYGWYFQDFAPQIRQTAQAAGPPDTGLFLRKLPGQPDAVIISGARAGIDAGVLEFLAPNAALCFAMDLETCRPQTKDEVVLIIAPSATVTIGSVRAAYPGGTLTVLHRYAGGARLVAYTLRPGRAG